MAVYFSCEGRMVRKTIDAAIIIPDASPILTLARIGRLDLFDYFTAPIKIVDQVQYEVTKKTNDPDGVVASWLNRKQNQIEVIETLVGFGFKVKRERGETPPGGNLGEIAVDEYASRLAYRASQTFIPLVLFEDPDVLETRIARLPRVHLMNTAAWIRGLADSKLISDGAEIIKEIDSRRKSPMVPIERPGRTNRVQSTWLRKEHKNDVS